MKTEISRIGIVFVVVLNYSYLELFNYWLYGKRRHNILKEDFEKQIQVLKKQHELSIKRLNDEIEKLYTEKQILIAELDSKQSHQLQNQQQLLHFNQTNHKSNRSNSSSSNAGGRMTLGGKTNSDLWSVSIIKYFPTIDSLSVGLLSASNQTASNINNNDEQQPLPPLNRKARGGLNQIELTRHEEHGGSSFYKQTAVNNDPKSGVNKNLNFDLDHLDASVSSLSKVGLSGEGTVFFI
jgi:hypothetical protein